MISKYELEAMRKRLDDALADYQAQVKKLYRSDGKPLYSDVEMKTQREKLMPTYLAAVQDAKLLAAKGREAANQLADSASLDPISRLSGVELERAFYLRPFVADEAAKAEPSELAARMRAVAASSDRPLQILYAKYAQARLDPANKEGRGSLEMIRAMQTLQGVLTTPATSESEVVRTMSTQLTMYATELQAVFDGSKDQASKSMLQDF